MANVTKIYELRTMGYNDVKKELADVAKGFDIIKKAKVAAEKGLLTSYDPNEIKKYADEVGKLKVKEQEHRTEIQRKTNEMKAINLERQKELQAARDQAKQNNIVAGSYNDIYRQYRELYNLTKNATSTSRINFRGQTLGFDEAIAKLKQLAAAEQDFRRQFSKDGLLVSEYTSGIVNAFKRMGLDDLIRGQITRAQQKVGELNQDFKGLQTELNILKMRGEMSFQGIEKEMVDNRNLAKELQKEIARLQMEYANAGSSGDKMNKSIKEGFKDLKGQIGSFMLQYIGITSLFSGISSGISRAKDEAIALDSLEAALKAVSKTEEEYAVNQAFINDLTEKYGVVLLDTTKNFKNFYASSTLAGIGADETRKIFEAATQAGAVLKLSQDDLNGVLLAFGQIASKGKVQAEELRGQIGERLPGAYSIAAKAMGVTQQQLDGMLKKGEVIASEFLPKFAKELTKTFNTGGEAIEGLSATINRNSNLFTQYLEQNRERVAKAITNLTKISGVLIMLASIIFGLPLPWLITGFATIILLSNTWLGVKARLLIAIGLETAALIIETAQLAIHNAARAAANLIIAAYTAAISLSTAATLRGAAALRVLATIIAALSTPIAAVVAVLAALVTIIGVVISKSNSASEATKKLIIDQAALAAQQRVNAEIAEKVGKATDNQIARLNKLLAIARDEKISMDVRKQSLQSIIDINPKYLKALTLEGFATGANKAILDKYIDSLKEAARRKAILAIIDQKEADKARIQSEAATTKAGNTTYEYDAQGKVVGYATRNDNSVKGVLSSIGFNLFGIGKGSVSDQLETADEKVKELNADLQNLYDTAKKENIVKDIVANEYNPINPGDDDKKKPYSGSRLTGDQKDKIKQLDAIRDQELAVNEASYLAQNKTEEEFLRRSKDINIKAIHDKVAFLNQSKKLNAEELKQVAQLKLEKQKLERETNEKLFDIRSKRLTDQFEADKKAAQDAADKIKNDPSLNVTGVQRAQAQLEADKAILALQEKYNKDMDTLEKTRNDQSTKNASDRKDALSNITQAITKNEAEVTKASLDDTKKAGEQILADFELTMDRAAALIQADNRLTQAEKNRQLQNLQREREYGLIVRQAANYKLLEAEFKRALDAGLVTLKEYEEIVAKLNELQQKIANDPKNTSVSFREAFRTDVGQDLMGVVSTAAGRFGASTQDKTILGVKTNAEQAQQYAKAFSNAISDSYSTAESIMTSYFNKEANAIEYNLKLQLERMKMEEDQLKAKARTTAEREAIEKRYDQRRKAAEQAAFEKTKELKKKEAKISLATELAGIWASVWSVGNPIAAAILGAVMTGLAVVRYGMRVSEINSQKFAFGGSPDDVPTRGGTFGGNPHSGGGTPFRYKGREFEAEVDELAVIRTKNANMSKRYTISGDFKQIASKLNELGGGVAFKPGGSVSKYYENGGYLGSQLQAPIMPNQSVYYQGAGETLEKFDEVIDAIDKKTDAINDRIDRLEVVQKTSTVTDAQAKEAKQKSIGTL